MKKIEREHGKTRLNEQLLRRRRKGHVASELNLDKLKAMNLGIKILTLKGPFDSSF